MISAVVLAAGLSRRMGRPKINLPWPPAVEGIVPTETGGQTVLGQVVSTLITVGFEDVVIVLGPVSPLDGPRWSGLPVRLVYNPRFVEGGMVSSLQAGLEELPAASQAALIVLADQPQLQAQVVQSVREAFLKEPQAVIVPSYRMRRGHPWLLPRRFWDEVRAFPATWTLRDFLKAHNEEIRYVPVDTPTILQDLDTPDDYHRLQENPRGG